MLPSGHCQVTLKKEIFNLNEGLYWLSIGQINSKALLLS